MPRFLVLTFYLAVFDRPLAVRTPPTCPPDPVVSEMVAYLRRDVRFEIVVRVGPSGRVVETGLVSPVSPQDSRFAEFALRCVAGAAFERPPQLPYRMKVAVQFPKSH